MQHFAGETCLCRLLVLTLAGWLSDQPMTLTAPGLEGLRAPGGPLSEDLFAGSSNPAASNGTDCFWLGFVSSKCSSVGSTSFVQDVCVPIC